MTRFSEVLNDPLQRTGEYWQRAHTILEQTPKSLLEEVTGDEFAYFLATPSVTPSMQPLIDPTAEDQKVFSQHYQIAARTTAGKYKRGQSLYLIMNGNFKSPVLQFGETSADLIVIGDEIEYLGDTTRYVPPILDAIQRRIDREIQTNQYDKSRVNKRRKRIGAAVAGVVTIGAIAGGVVKFIQDGWADDRRRAAAERVEFDNRNVDIPSQPIQAGDLGFIEPNLSFFANKVPGPAKGDTFSHPRSVSLDSSDDCTDVTDLDPNSQSAVAVTDGASERFTLVVNSNGAVKVCTLDQNASSSEDVDAPQVAVQVVDRVSQ